MTIIDTTRVPDWSMKTSPVSSHNNLTKQLENCAANNPAEAFSIAIKIHEQDPAKPVVIRGKHPAETRSILKQTLDSLHHPHSFVYG